MSDFGPQWHIDRLKMFERHLLGMLDGTLNQGMQPAGEYRAHLERELARIRGHLARLEGAQ